MSLLNSDLRAATYCPIFDLTSARASLGLLGEHERRDEVSDAIDQWYRLQVWSGTVTVQGARAFHQRLLSIYESTPEALVEARDYIARAISRVAAYTV